MRLLTTQEICDVAGGVGDGEWWPPIEDVKNNNGYGNGPEGGPPPGNSGAHNPQLLEWNLGPNGLR